MIDVETSGSPPESADARHLGAVEEPTAKPSAEPAVRSLVELYSIKGATVKKFLGELDKGTAWSFDPDDSSTALELLPEKDPDLRKTRSLVHEATTTREGRFSRTALDFAGRAIAGDLRGMAWPPPEDAAPEPVLDGVGSVLEERLGATTPERRAVNVLMLAIEHLSVRNGLAVERTLPFLQTALGEPAAYRKPRRNKRRTRVALLTEPRVDLERIRIFADVVTPWTDRIDELERELRGAREMQAAADARARSAETRLAEVESAAAELQADLEAARQKETELGSRVRDVGIVARSDVTELRARYQSFINGRLRDLLGTAREAAELEPPRTQTSLKMLDQALAEIRKEVEWLRSSA